METKELYYPQISAQAGSYTFEEGVELEILRHVEKRRKNSD